MNDLADEELMSMFRDGDSEAFETLFARYHGLIYNFAYTMTGDAGAAEDIMQETFIAAVRAAGRYEARGQFRAWLARICRNRCLNALDARKARQQATGEMGLQLACADAGRLPPNPAERSDTMRAVREAIGRLPQQQREVIALYAFEHMRYREISEALDMPINTVKTLIHRARAALARTVEMLKKGTVNT